MGTLQEEHYNDWFNDHKTGLEEDFLKQLPPEEMPNDDDTPDYMDNHWDEFEKFAKDRYKEEV